MDEKDRAKYKSLFMEVSTGYLKTFTDSLTKAKENKNDIASVKEAFRVAHNLKGTAATMGYDKITQVAREMEDSLDAYREGEKFLTDDIIGLLYECHVILTSLVDEVDCGEDKGIDLTDILNKMKAFSSQG